MALLFADIEKSPGRCRGFGSARYPGSVLRDDRTAEMKIDAGGNHVDAQIDAVVAGNSGDGNGRESEVLAAHEAVVVFQRERPVRQEANFDTGADCTAETRFGRLIECRADSETVIRVVRERRSALHVPQDVVPGVADLAGEQSERIGLRLIAGPGIEEACIG